MKAALTALIFLSIGGFLAWILAPTLWTDYKIQGTKRLVASDVQIDEAKCRTRLFIISFCTIRLNPDRLRPARPNPGKLQSTAASNTTKTTELNYFLLSSLDSEKVIAMRSIGTREVLTTSMGMDHLTNRIVSFIAFAGFMLVVVIGGFLRAIRGKAGR